jgi:mono/diheme cytochrome c family protein
MFRTVLIGVVTLALPALAAAQEKKIEMKAAPMTSAADGAQMFKEYCASCHGTTGKGDGPAASALKTKPADLTQLAKTHPGGLSQKDFEERIQGTNMPSSHGSSPMPVWGPVLRTFGNDQLRIYNLKKYVDSLAEPTR